MEDRIQFQKLLKPIRRQLFIQLIIKEAQLLLMIAGAMSLFLLFIARIIIISFISYYFSAIIFALLVYFFIRIWKQWPKLQDAAAIYNEFVPDDRVHTAFRFLHSDSIIAALQLSDAVKEMKKSRDAIYKRKKKLLYPKWLLFLLIFTAGAIILYNSPNDKINSAKQKEQEIKLIADTKKKLKEEIKKEKNQEVKKALESAKEKLEESKSAQEALTELGKQKKELELKALKEKEKQLALENWKSELRKTGLNPLEKALDEKSLAHIEKELNKFNEKWNDLSEVQKKAINQLSEKEGQLSEEDIERLMEQIEQALKSEEFLTQLAAAAQALQQAGYAMQKQMASNGLPPSQLAFAPPGQPNHQGKPPSSSQQNGQNGNGQQPNTNSANPSGSNGSGSGQGNSAGGNGSGGSSGMGAGSGSGSGSGSGAGGSGAGKGQGSRKLLTIPEKLGGQANVETDSGSLSEGSPLEQTDGTGPVLKGTIKPYSEVYETYEKAYRQSIDRYKLPADLEEIVKNYFTTIDPSKE